MNAQHFIIKLAGGLGNQMFQYAFGVALAGRGAHVEYDLSWFGRVFDDDITPRDFELKRIFNIPLPLAEPRLVARWSDTAPGLHHRIRRRICGRKRKHVCEHDFGGHGYHPEILSLPAAYLDGYWQHLGYLAGAEAAIRKLFAFPPVSDDRNRRYLAAIESSQSVALHVRRGDYVNKALIHPPLSTAYYRAGISHMRNHIANPSFFVFSDDHEWAAANLPLSGAVHVRGNEGGHAFRDLQLMCRCRHIIIANSTFSWWSAWLTAREDKQVVVPSYYAKTGQLSLPAWHRLADGKEV